MDVLPVLQKEASGYVATFEPSWTIESGMLKKGCRTDIEERVDALGYKEQAEFYQLVLEGLQVLQEKVKQDEPIHEVALDLIELKILATQKLLKNANHQVSSVLNP